MLPTSEGIWRWKRKDDGREFDLPVYNVGDGDLYFRIKFLNRWHDIDDLLKGAWVAKVNHNPDGYITKQIRGWVHPEDHKEALAVLI